MRGKNVISISLVLVLFLSLGAIKQAKATTPTIYVNPIHPPAPLPIPGQTYTFTIGVSDAPMVSGWEFKLRWNWDVLKFPPTVFEGTFLSKSGYYMTDFFVHTSMPMSYVQVGCSLAETPEPGNEPQGNGILATIRFVVNSAGITDLHLFDVKMVDLGGEEIVPPPNTVDGEFHTSVPFASFNWSPAQVIPGDNVTFDASASFDPDGGAIIEYKWDFGDGTPIVVENDPITWHICPAYRFNAYMVTLTVKDDDLETWSKTTPLRVWRDVVVSDIWPTFDDWDLLTANMIWLRGSIEYYGPGWGYGPTLTVIGTLYNAGSKDERVLYTVTATQQATGVVFPIDQYYMNVKAGLGSGWGGWTYWWLLDENDEYLPAGFYTITVSVEPFPGECDTTNNVMSIEIEIVELRTDLINKRITNHAFSISSHGDTMWFYSKIKNRQNTLSYPCPLGTGKSWVEFEIEDPHGETIVLETNEIDPTMIAPDAEVEMEPQAFNVTGRPFGTYTATAMNYYYFDDPTGNTNPWNKRFLSETKIITFSFSLRP